MPSIEGIRLEVGSGDARPYDAPIILCRFVTRINWSYWGGRDDHSLATFTQKDSAHGARRGRKWSWFNFFSIV